MKPIIFLALALSLPACGKDDDESGEKTIPGDVEHLEGITSCSDRGGTVSLSGVYNDPRINGILVIARAEGTQAPSVCNKDSTSSKDNAPVVFYESLNTTVSFRGCLFNPVANTYSPGAVITINVCR